MDFEIYLFKTDCLCFMDVTVQISGLCWQMTSTNSLSDNIVWMKYELLPEDCRSLWRNFQKCDINAIYRVGLECLNLIPITEIK